MSWVRDRVLSKCDTDELVDLAVQLRSCLRMRPVCDSPTESALYLRRLSEVMTILDSRSEQLLLFYVGENSKPVT